MPEPICGDCPDHTRLSSDNSVGYCQIIDDYQSSTHPACPPRRRELKALEEVEKLKRKLAELIVLAARLEKEFTRWQNEIYKLCKNAVIVGGVQQREIDGSGCDSGDSLDLTLDEISQVVNFWKDRCADKENIPVRRAYDLDAIGRHRKGG